MVAVFVATNPHLTIEMWGTQQRRKQIPFGDDNERERFLGLRDDVDWTNEFSGYADAAVAQDGGDAVAGEGDASASGCVDLSAVYLSW